jgi:DNA polymerase III subunit gamma/tau
VLNRVAASESIELDEGATAMIARSASGSFRDALGTLDQLVAFGGEHVELDDVLEMLGAADAELLFEAVDAVLVSDPKGVLLGVEKMARSGRDPAQFARDLLAHLRFLLVTQTTGEVPTSFVVTATDSARLEAQAATVGAATLVRTIDELADALTAVREGDDARMAVEIALLKAARPDLDPSTEGLLRRIEQLERQLGGGQGTPPAPAAAAAAAEPAAEPAAAEREPEPEVATPDPEPEPAAEESPPPAAEAGQSDLNLDELKRIWPSVLDKLAETAPALAATFEGAYPVAFDADGLQIGFPPDKTFNKRKAESPERRDAVAAAFEVVAGQALRPSYVLLEAAAEVPVDEAAPAPAAADEKMDEEELLARLKSEFDAEEVS